MRTVLLNTITICLLNVNIAYATDYAKSTEKFLRSYSQCVSFEQGGTLEDYLKSGDDITSEIFCLDDPAKTGLIFCSLQFTGDCNRMLGLASYTTTQSEVHKLMSLPISEVCKENLPNRIHGHEQIIPAIGGCLEIKIN